MGIAGGVFAQDRSALAGLLRGQALGGRGLHGTAEAPERSCASEPVKGQEQQGVLQRVCRSWV